MGIVGGTSRHYHGPTSPEAHKWVCPACHAENVGRRVEDGCGVCGVGTPEQQARAAASKVADAITDEQIVDRVYAMAMTHPLLEYLEPAAQNTLLAALAHYAEFGAPTADMLDVATTLAWARLLNKENL